MAEKLVESMSEKWDPSKWKDDYRDEILKLVREKVESGSIRTIDEPKKEAASGGQIIDLMSRLKESMARQKAGRGRAPETRAVARGATAKRTARRRVSSSSASHVRARKTA